MLMHSQQVEQALREGKKMEAIRLLRLETGVGLADAKQYVEDLQEMLAMNTESGENAVEYMDSLDGREFEHFCASVLWKNGFSDVQVTPSSGDQGVDILATKDDIKYAIQCKHYQSALGNTPVQEVESGRQFYGCHVGVVMTNSFFTPGAFELAKKTNTLLWDRNRMMEMTAGTKFLQNGSSTVKPISTSAQMETKKRLFSKDVCLGCLTVILIIMALIYFVAV